MSDVPVISGAEQAAPAPAIGLQRIGLIEPALALALFSLLVLGVLAWNHAYGTVMAIWPAGGVLLGFLLARPQCPQYPLLAAALALDIVARLLLGESALHAILLALLNLSEVGLAIYLVRRMIKGGSSGLQRSSDLADKLIPASLFASLAMAALAAFLVPASLPVSMASFLSQGLCLWMSSTVGMSAAGLLTMELLHPKLAASKRKAWHLAKLALVALACAVAAWAVFAQTRHPLLYLLAGMMVFVGYFTGLRGVSLGILAMAVLGSWFTAQGSGPLALSPGAGLEERMLGLHAFAFIGSLTVLIFTSALTALSRDRVANQRTLSKMMAVMATSPVGICFTRRSRFELASASFEAMFGFAQGGLIGQTPAIIFETPAAYMSFSSRYRAAFEGRRPFVEEIHFLRSDGSRFWGKVQGAPIRDEGQITGAIWTIEDITESRELRERLSWSATHDPLTDLVNRREFEARLADWLKTRASGVKASVLFIDLDRFKAVNDIAGHAAGDRILKDMAAIMLGAVRQGDTVARMGGDEFAILLSGCTSNLATRIAEKVRESVQAHVLQWNDERLAVGASVGLVDIDERFHDVAAIIAAADLACYAAKNAGRNSVMLA